MYNFADFIVLFSLLTQLFSRINVEWGTMSIVEAYLACYEPLIKHEWSHLLHMTGRDFPLKTNLELVRAVKPLGKKSDMEVIADFLKL